MWFSSPECSCPLPVDLTVTSHKGYVLASGLLHLFWKLGIWRVSQGERGTVPFLWGASDSGCLSQGSFRTPTPIPRIVLNPPCPSLLFGLSLERRHQFPKPPVLVFVLEKLLLPAVDSAYWGWGVGRDICWHRLGKSFLFSSAACVHLLPPTPQTIAGGSQ